MIHFYNDDQHALNYSQFQDSKNVYKETYKVLQKEKKGAKHGKLIATAIESSTVNQGINGLPEAAKELITNKFYKKLKKREGRTFFFEGGQKVTILENDNVIGVLYKYLNQFKLDIRLEFEENKTQAFGDKKCNCKVFHNQVMIAMSGFQKNKKIAKLNGLTNAFQSIHQELYEESLHLTFCEKELENKIDVKLSKMKLDNNTNNTPPSQEKQYHKYSSDEYQQKDANSNNSLPKKNQSDESVHNIFSFEQKSANFFDANDFIFTFEDDAMQKLEQAPSLSTPIKKKDHLIKQNLEQQQKNQNQQKQQQQNFQDQKNSEISKKTIKVEEPFEDVLSSLKQMAEDSHMSSLPLSGNLTKSNNYYSFDQIFEILQKVVNFYLKIKKDIITHQNVCIDSEGKFIQTIQTKNGIKVNGKQLNVKLAKINCYESILVEAFPKCQNMKEVLNYLNQKEADKVKDKQFLSPEAIKMIEDIDFCDESNNPTSKYNQNPIQQLETDNYKYQNHQYKPVRPVITQKQPQLRSTPKTDSQKKNNIQSWQYCSQDDLQQNNQKRKYQKRQKKIDKFTKKVRKQKLLDKRQKTISNYYPQMQ